MKPRWEDVSEILAGATALSGDKREAFLAEKCGGDTALETEIRSLLAHHAESSGFLRTGGAELEAPVVAGVDEAPAKPLAGTRIGAWRAVREIGRGGMGEVFLVERDDGQFRQNGALKLIRAGLWTEEMIRRMRRERQILAGLDHPNIARLLDGGTTAEGMPYLVMEYVDGEPLLEWASRRTLGPRERIALFLDVCAAVQSAHQKLVLHRDLKPGNILVSREGQPKLLDFGIAKLFDDEAEELRTLNVPLTPGYASPEQLRGESVTTASDVYSLGVLLHELLTGQKPGASAAGPTRPRHELRGDLETIVRKALEEDPARRYPSVEQLAEDLRRHLDGRPVLARPDSWSYRAGRFARRNRAAVTAAGIAVLALVVGLAAALWQARVAGRERDLAQRRFDEVRELARGIVFPIYDAIENLPGSTEARQLVVEHALRYLDRLYAEAPRDPGLQRELAMAYRKIGDVQGRAFYGNLGQTDQSLESYRRSFELFDRAAKVEPESLSNREAVAAGHRMTEILRKTGHHDEGMKYALAARARLDDLLARFPNEELLQKDLNISCDRLADGYLAAADTAAALAQRRRALAVIEGLVQRKPDEPRYRRGIIVDCLKTADLLGATGHTEEASSLYRRAEEVGRERVALDSHDNEARRDLSVVYSKYGVFLSWTGQIDSALATYGRGHAIAEAMAAEDPKDASMRFDVWAGHYEMGASLAQGARWREAFTQFHTAYGGFSILAAADTSDVDSYASVGDAAWRMGESCRQLSGDARAGAERAHWRGEGLRWTRRGLDVYGDLGRRDLLSEEQKGTMQRMEQQMKELVALK